VKEKDLLKIKLCKEKNIKLFVIEDYKSSKKSITELSSEIIKQIISEPNVS
jgi:hypothetical protein